MEKNKNQLSNSKKDYILSYSLSSQSLNVKRDEFENNIEINIKDTKELFKEYTVLKKIGKGTFGLVVLAIHIQTNEKVAIKILEKEKIIGKSDFERIKREIQILKNLRHNNIVQLYNVIDTQMHIYLITEYVNGIELFDYILKQKRINEIESCYLYQQIISGIEYLGKLNITHRDIKPENLLIDKNKKIKIVDFGLSNICQENQLLSTACGSPFYAAPEILRGEKYNGLKLDIWSSGIVLYAMLCGFLPFDDTDNQKLYQKIIKGDFEYPDFLSNEVIDLISHILIVDPNKRFGIKEIKNHKWFNIVNKSLNMSEGLLINKYIIPFDENIVLFMASKFNLNLNEIKKNILYNKFNQLTTTYYLLLNKKIRNNQETIGNMNSNLFLEYIHNEKNLLSYYDYNIDEAINERINNKANKEGNNIPKHKNIMSYIEKDYKLNRYKMEISDNGKKGNEIRITKININNIIIPKNFLNYSGIKDKPKKMKNKNININQFNEQSDNCLNKTEIKINNSKSIFNENIFPKLVKNNKFEFFKNSYTKKNNNNKIRQIFIKLEKPYNILTERKNSNNNYYYNTIRNSRKNFLKLNEENISNDKNINKTKREILTSYKKKRILSNSFQKPQNSLNNESEFFSNEFYGKNNKNNNNIKIMNNTQTKKIYSNNYSPKSKIFTYKKIKISKKLNISRPSESNESSKIYHKNSRLNTRLSFNSTSDNFYSKKKYILNSSLFHRDKNKENEIIFKNPVIEHIYERKTVNNNYIKNNEEQILTEGNNNERDIFLNKFKIIKQKNQEKKIFKKNKFIISNNLTNYSTNIKLNNNNFNTNSSVYANKNNSKNNKNFNIKSLQPNKFLFKKPQLNNKNNINEKHYIPFDLNSLILYPQENDIKNVLIKELNYKKIKLNEKKNKISCFKKDLKFELKIEKIDKYIFCIKFIKKGDVDAYHFYKDIYINLINDFNKF